MIINCNFSFQLFEGIAVPRYEGGDLHRVGLAFGLFFLEIKKMP